MSKPRSGFQSGLGLGPTRWPLTEGSAICQCPLGEYRLQTCTWTLTGPSHCLGTRLWCERGGTQGSARCPPGQGSRVGPVHSS